MYASTLGALRTGILSASIIALALSTVAQTTMADYTYLSKGVLAVAANKQEKNPAYEFGEKHIMSAPVTQTSGLRKSVVAVMYRSATKEPAGILFVLERTDTDFSKVLGIPLPSSGADVLSLARKDFDAATSEWSDQARTYAWHLAMAFAAEVEERGAKTSTAEVKEPAHPIDARLTQCVASDVGGTEDTYVPGTSCYITAVQEWEKELKRTEIDLLARIDEGFRADLQQSFKAWDAFYTNAYLGLEWEVFTAHGMSEWELNYRSAQISMLKGRIATLAQLSRLR